MSIPRVTPYAMPAPSELPRNTVSWQLESGSAALLIHDMQRYFLNAYPPDESPVTMLVDNIALLRKRCADAGMPVVFTAQPGHQLREERGLLYDFWGPGLRADTEIAAELAPETGLLVTKRRYSAFHGTELLDLLARRGRRQLIVCGVYTHIGCLMTAADAFMHDVQPFVVADATADFSAEHHHAALRYVATRVGCIRTVDQIVETLDGGA